MSVELIHGDCLEVMPTLPKQSVQMVFADLPYRSKKFQSTDCHWDIAINLENYWGAVSHSVFLTTPVIMTGSQPFTSLLVQSNIAAFQSHLVWDKNSSGGFMRARTRPMRFHEDIIVFYRKQPTYNPQMIPLKKPRTWRETHSERTFSGGPRTRKKGLIKIRTHLYPKSIITACMASDKARGLHPTQKPVALLEWLIKTYTNPGDTVLDPVAGSGTTAIAAMRTGRNAICIEKDATYFAAMQKRVADERARMQQEEVAP